MNTAEDNIQHPLVRRTRDTYDRNDRPFFHTLLSMFKNRLCTDTQEDTLSQTSTFIVNIRSGLLLTVLVAGFICWAAVCHFGYCSASFLTPTLLPAGSSGGLHFTPLQQGATHGRANTSRNTDDVDYTESMPQKEHKPTHVDLKSKRFLKLGSQLETKKGSRVDTEQEALAIQSRLDAYSMMTEDKLKKRFDGFFDLNPEDVNFLSYHFHPSDPRSALPPLLTSVDSAGEDPLPVDQLVHDDKQPSSIGADSEIDEEHTYSEPCGSNCWILRTARDAVRMQVYLAVKANLISPHEAEAQLAGTAKVLFEDNPGFDKRTSFSTEVSGMVDRDPDIAGWIPGYHNFGMPRFEAGSSVPLYSPPSPPVPFPRGSVLPSLRLNLKSAKRNDHKPIELGLDSPLVHMAQINAVPIQEGDRQLDETLRQISSFSVGGHLNLANLGVTGVEVIHWPLVFNRTSNSHHLLGMTKDVFEMPPLLIPNHYRVQSNTDAFINKKRSTATRISPSLPIKTDKGHQPTMQVRAENRLPELQFLRSPFVLKLQTCQRNLGHRTKCFRGLVISSEGYGILSDPSRGLDVTTPLVLIPGAPCHYGLAMEASLAAIQNAKHPKDAIRMLHQFEKRPNKSQDQTFTSPSAPASSDSTKRIHRSKTVGIVLSQLFGHGAFHWIVECLPRIVYLKPLIRILNLAGSFQSSEKASADSVFLQYSAYIHVPRDFVPWRGSEASRIGIGNSGISTLIRRSLQQVLETMGVTLPEDRIVGGDIKFDMAYLPPATSCGRVSPIAGPLMRTVLQRVVSQYRSAKAKSIGEEGNISSNLSGKSLLKPGVIFVQRKGKRELLQWTSVTSAFRKLLPELAHLPGAPRPVTWTMAHNPPSFEIVMDRFMDAQALVAPHGAGMANSIVSPSGLIVFEITASDWKPGNCYQMLAWYLKHRWWGISPKVNDRERFLRLDQDELQSALTGFSKMVRNPEFTSITSTI